jgi:ParB/RepB/Spo0J family partition protein
MNVKIKTIYVDPERVRQKAGLLEKLKLSLTKVGQLHPLIVEPSTRDGYKYDLIAGYRRYTSMMELEWEDCEVIVKEGLTPIERIDIELEENLRRKNLYAYEIAMGMLKRKRLYEDIHPETKRAANEIRDTKGKFAPVSTRGATRSILDTEKSKEIEEPAPRFSKVTADHFDLSERTVQKHVQIAKAIDEKKFDKETIEAYKKKEISQREMLRLDRERRDKERAKEQQTKLREERSRLGRQAAIEAMEEELIEESVYSEMREAVNNVRKDEGLIPLKLCGDCKHTENYNCPSCGEEIFVCNESSLFKLVESGSEACKDFSK